MKYDIEKTFSGEYDNSTVLSIISQCLSLFNSTYSLIFQNQLRKQFGGNTTEYQKFSNINLSQKFKRVQELLPTENLQSQSVFNIVKQIDIPKVFIQPRNGFELRWFYESRSAQSILTIWEHPRVQRYQIHLILCTESTFLGMIPKIETIFKTEEPKQQEQDSDNKLEFKLIKIESEKFLGDNGERCRKKVKLTTSISSLLPNFRLNVKSFSKELGHFDLRETDDIFTISTPDFSIVLYKDSIQNRNTLSEESYQNLIKIVKLLEPQIQKTFNEVKKDLKSWSGNESFLL